MTESRQGVQRRRHRRVAIQSRGDAMLFGPNFSKGVQVVELSMGGIAFRYVAGYERLVEPLEMDILWDHLGVFLLKLKIKIVSDFQIPSEYILGVIPVRRCSAQFMELTRDQTSQLAYFIENHSMSDVEAARPRAVNQVVKFQEEEPWKPV